MFEREAKENGTTVDFEREKDKLEQEFIHRISSLGRSTVTSEERAKHNEDIANLKMRMLGTT